MSHPSRELLDELKRKQIAFLQSRLVSDAARVDWRTNLEAGYKTLLDHKLSDLASPESTIAWIESALLHETFDGATAPLYTKLHGNIVERLNSDAATLKSYIPSSAKANIDLFLQRKGLIPEHLVREVFEQDAMEEVMRDVLFDALKTFNESVNPFFADWGLPGLIKRFLPIGSGAVLKSMDALRAEFDKRLEPEIRKFLQGFSRKALKKMADFTIASSDEPKSVDVRRAVVAWFYEQDVKSLVELSGREGGHELGRAIVLDIARHVMSLDASKIQRREAVSRFFANHADKTLSEILAAHGITANADFDAIAAASWPVVATTLSSEPAKAWFTSLISDFFDSVEAA
jgi:hypothetical protein